MKSSNLKCNHLVLALTGVIALWSLAPMARGEDESGRDPAIDAPMITESCVLKITWDGRASAMSSEVAEAMVQSSGVWGNALMVTFGDDLSRVHQAVSIELEPLNIRGTGRNNSAGLTTMVARLVIEVKGDAVGLVKGNARPLMKLVCELLNKSILDFGESTIRNRHEMRANYAEELELAQKELYRIRTERHAFLKKTQAMELDRKLLDSELRQLQQQKAELELEQAVDHARRDAMQEQIARLSARAKNEPIKPADIEQLENILKLREEALEFGKAKVRSDRVSENELNDLKIEVAQAAAELARAQADARREHEAKMQEMGGAFIIEMNHELTRMAIDEADTQAKYHATLARIERVRQSLEFAEEYERLGGDRLEIAQERLNTVHRNLANIEQSINTSPRPTITIIGAD